MNKVLQRFITLATVGAMALSMVACGGEKDETIILKNVTQAKNVILMIGDGMGPHQIRAGELYKGEKLTMQKFPYSAFVETRSASDAITDSAAAATALATGTRTTNGVVGKDSSYQDLETIVDIAAKLGKRTGILATEALSGATPMGFSGHANSRNYSEELLESAATSGNVNLFASAVLKATYHSIFEEAGYEKLINADDISQSTSDKVFGSYVIQAASEPMSANGGMVAFDRLVTEALEYLSKDEDGFFLMAEGSHIDHGGHDNNFAYMLEELIAFDNAVEAVLKWAKGRDDTVVIVTADHETGGLFVSPAATHEMVKQAYTDYKTSYIENDECYEWTTSGHTNTDVCIFINGADINFAQYSFNDDDYIKNTDVFHIMNYLMTGTVYTPVVE